MIPAFMITLWTNLYGKKSLPDIMSTEIGKNWINTGRKYNLQKGKPYEAISRDSETPSAQAYFVFHRVKTGFGFVCGVCVEPVYFCQKHICGGSLAAGLLLPDSIFHPLDMVAVSGF